MSHARRPALPAARRPTAAPCLGGGDARHAGSGDRGRGCRRRRPLFRARGADPDHPGGAAQLFAQPAGRAAAPGVAGPRAVGDPRRGPGARASSSPSAPRSARRWRSSPRTSRATRPPSRKRSRDCATPHSAGSRTRSRASATRSRAPPPSRPSQPRPRRPAPDRRPSSKSRSRSSSPSHHVGAADRREGGVAGSEPAGDHRHHPGRGDLHPAAEGGSARPRDSAVRIRRFGAHDGGDERRRAAAQPLLPDPARPQYELWRDRRVGLYFIGVPNPVLWGVLGTLLRFIPYIGSWIAAALPIGLAAAVEPGWSMVIWTAALYVVTELTMGQAVEPLVYGHSTGLSPLAVIIAAIFWTWIWGPIGLIISTPLTLCLVLLGRYVERLEFLDVLLGDRPPLTPVESFYQRMLAGDPDEAEEQAERYLADRPLSSYYDEVALEACGSRPTTSRAARWRRRRSSTSTHRSTSWSPLSTNTTTSPRPIAEARTRTVAGPTRRPAGAAEGAAAGRGRARRDASSRRSGAGKPRFCASPGAGALDEAAANMLAQLLGKHGLGARVGGPRRGLPCQDRVARSARGRDDLRLVPRTSAATRPTCAICCGGCASACPRRRCWSGFWPAQNPILTDRDLRRAIGADYYVSTLHDAVEACLAGARRAAAPKPQTRGHGPGTRVRLTRIVAPRRAFLGASGTMSRPIR